MTRDEVPQFNMLLTQLRHAYPHDFAWGPQSIPVYWQALENMPGRAVFRALELAPSRFPRMPSAYELLELARLQAKEMAQKDAIDEARARASRQLPAPSEPDGDNVDMSPEARERHAAFRKRVEAGLASGLSMPAAIGAAVDGCETIVRDLPKLRRRG